MDTRAIARVSTHDPIVTPAARISSSARSVVSGATPAEVADYLQSRSVEFTVPVLKEIARALGPTVNSTGRTKAQLRRDIVEGTAGFRVRSAAMSGGAWAKP